MGNSMGIGLLGFDAFKQEYAGGFIWEWYNHGYKVWTNREDSTGPMVVICGYTWLMTKLLYGWYHQS